jgi:hypothetical protein
MGRIAMYVAIVVLAIFVATSYFVFEHGGGSIAAPSDNAAATPDAEVTVHDLTLNSMQYEGQRVITEGTLTFSDEHDHYQVADNGNYAVVIRNFSNEAKLERLEGERVRVEGVFGQEAGTGTYIDAAAIEAAAQ